jgi:hypothetical protein
MGGMVVVELVVVDDVVEDVVEEVVEDVVEDEEEDEDDEDVVVQGPNSAEAGGPGPLKIGHTATRSLLTAEHGMVKSNGPGPGTDVPSGTVPGTVVGSS